MSDDDDFDGAPPRDAVVDRRGKRQVLATGFGLAAWANYMYPLLLSPVSVVSALRGKGATTQSAMPFFLAYLLSAGFGKTTASSSYPAVARHEYLSLHPILQYGVVVAKIQPPPAPRDNKNAAERTLRNLMTQRGTTNIWAGIDMALDMFEEADTTGQVPAIILLSDGVTTCAYPSCGLTNALRGRMPFKPSIHTFGLGPNHDSRLMASVANIGDGTYCFVSNLAIMQTLFVHTMANLRSTYATRATLQVTCTNNIIVSDDLRQRRDDTDDGSLALYLGNIQYGQSRDIVLKVQPARYEAASALDQYVAATVTLRPVLEGLGMAKNRKSTICLADKSRLPEGELAYHASRGYICSFLADLLGAEANGDIRIPLVDLETRLDNFDSLIHEIPAQDYHDELNRSLMKDLNGAKLQISTALDSDEHYESWGKHYLAGLLSAHARQVRSSFQAVGPLQYGVNSRLFNSCHHRLTRVYNTMPPPKPAAQVIRSGACPTAHRDARVHNNATSQMHNVTESRHGGDAASTKQESTQVLESAMPTMPGQKRSFEAMNWNQDGRKEPDNDGDSQATAMTPGPSQNAACFAHGTPLTLEAGVTAKVQDLRYGDMVQTLAGRRLVVGVLRTFVENEVLCRLGDVLVTAWHPVSFDGIAWGFPVHLTVDPIMYTGDVYSILLEVDRRPFAHTVLAGGLWGTTLGHGITGGGEGANDVRAHPFFGDYLSICDKIAVLRRINGAYQCYGVTRDRKTGLVNGFRTCEPKPDASDAQP
ncbi:hypothetical protein NHJ6243_006963 [Beauveria neobassiana]